MRFSSCMCARVGFSNLSAIGDCRFQRCDSTELHRSRSPPRTRNLKTQWRPNSRPTCFTSTVLKVKAVLRAITNEPLMREGPWCYRSRHQRNSACSGSPPKFANGGCRRWKGVAQESTCATVSAHGTIWIAVPETVHRIGAPRLGLHFLHLSTKRKPVRCRVLMDGCFRRNRQSRLDDVQPRRECRIGHDTHLPDGLDGCR